MPRKPTKANGTVWNKDVLAQQETVSSSSSSEAVQPPPTWATPFSPGATQKEPPPNYKLKLALLKTLKENYKVDDATLDQVADLFHIFARASVIKV